MHWPVFVSCSSCGLKIRYCDSPDKRSGSKQFFLAWPMQEFALLPLRVRMFIRREGMARNVFCTAAGWKWRFEAIGGSGSGLSCRSLRTQLRRIESTTQDSRCDACARSCKNEIKTYGRCSRNPSIFAIRSQPPAKLMKGTTRQLVQNRI